MSGVKPRARPAAKKACCPPESCKPSADLEARARKAKDRVVSLSKNEEILIDRAFPPPPPPPGPPPPSPPPPSSCSLSSVAFIPKSSARSMDEETMDKYCPERHPDFFSGLNFFKIENLFVKMHYLDWAEQFFVFWAKPNTLMDANIGPSFMKISAFELDGFVEWIDETLNDIDANKPNLIERLKHPNAVIKDATDDRCWDSAFTYKTPSDMLKIRPYRNNIGIYQFKLWMEKGVQSFNQREWKGPTMTLNRSVVVQWLKVLKHFQNLIRASDTQDTSREPDGDSQPEDMVESEDDEDGNDDDDDNHPNPAGKSPQTTREGFPEDEVQELDFIPNSTTGARQIRYKGYVKK